MFCFPSALPFSSLRVRGTAEGCYPHTCDAGISVGRNLDDGTNPCSRTYSFLLGRIP